MPLVCQTRLETGKQRALAAFTKAETWVVNATTSRRFDLWAAWKQLSALRDAAAHLPEDFGGYWVEVVAQADPAHLNRYLEWARTLRGGTLRLQSLDLERQAEVVFHLDGEPAWPLEHDALDPRLRGRTIPRGVVAYSEQGVHDRGDARLELAASRVKAAYERAAHVVDEVPTLELDGVARRWGSVAAFEPKVPWGVLGEKVGGAAQSVQLQAVDGAPDGLRLTLGSQIDARVATFGAWAGLLDDLDVVVVRCCGTLEALDALIDALELREHPERPSNSFGLTTVGQAEVTGEGLAGLLSLASGASDWGLRWSDLRWRIPERDPGQPDDSFYLVRTERRRTYDNLLVSLDVDDPEDERFRVARRELARLVHDDLGQAAAWAFEGAPVSTPRGQRFAALTAALEAEVGAVLETAVAVPAKAPRGPPAAVRWLKGLATRGSGHIDIVGAATRALSEAAPGFRHDRRAHATEMYYIDFVRATPNGFQYVQIERTHREPGHRARVGVSRFRARLADLDPGVGRASHGLVLPLEALVPERADVCWTYRTQRGCDLAMNDLATLVAARAVPFFERADAHLARLAEEA